MWAPVYAEIRYAKGMAAKLPQVPGAFGRSPEPNHVAMIQQALCFSFFIVIFID
ncbi:MAG: hypothetical protein MRK02_16360 [Candidatus Scalindua sp.]|nr:hypothetical protein [Candidatus Scalindua sp.]